MLSFNNKTSTKVRVGNLIYGLGHGLKKITSCVYLKLVSLTDRVGRQHILQKQAQQDSKVGQRMLFYHVSLNVKKK